MMEARPRPRTPTAQALGAAPDAASPVSRTVLGVGVLLGGLTSIALSALRPPICSDLCTVHGFLAVVVAVILGLYVLLGRQEGARTGAWFVVSFGAGVILCGLVISAARLADQAEDVLLEPTALQRVDARHRAV